MLARTRPLTRGILLLSTDDEQKKMEPFCEPSTFSTSDRSRVLEPMMPFMDMYCDFSGKICRATHRQRAGVIEVGDERAVCTVRRFERC